MKNLKTILIVIGLAIAASSCAQRSIPSASELLKDNTMRDSIMTEISGNPQLMNNMMDHIRSNPQAMQMMQNGSMMQNGTMMQNGRMMQNSRMQGMNMTGGDSTRVQNMYNMMAQNPAMMSMMLNMMAQNPQSMQMMQNMMQQKGMMGGKDMMNK